MATKNDIISGKAFDYLVIKRIFTYVKPYKIKFFICLGIVLLLSVLSVSRPLLIQKTINDYVLNGNEHMLLVLTFILIGIVFTEAILQLSNIFLTSFLGMSVVQDLRNQVYSHILKMRNKYFDTTPVGTLVTRSVSDIESLGEVFSEGFIIIFGDILMLVVFASAMFIVNFKLTLVAIITVPILIVATAIFKKGVKVSFQLVRNAVSSLNTFVQEHLSGISIVQIFTSENKEYESFKKINEEHKKANIKGILFYSIFFPIVEILSSISLGLVIITGGLVKNVLPGDIVLFVMLIQMFFRPIRMLADRINTLQMGMVASERVFKVLDTNDEILNEGLDNCENIVGTIEFKNVWFAYKNEDWILKDVSFKIEAGQSVAIVGSTGSGKTTVINVLGRYYEYSAGEILLDGKNIREYELGALRKKIGTVLQDVFLFSDTVLNNITLYNENVTIEEVEEAAGKIEAIHFINQLPGRFEFKVMERGNTLSAGQRQIISFLRAYVQQPTVLVLDEATSSIDSETELLMQKAIEKITHGRTSLVIAHRLSTIQKANKIIVFEKGQVIEEGSLQELLKNSGPFKKLYDMQYDKNELQLH